MKPCLLLFLAIAFAICAGHPAKAAEPSDKIPPGEVISHNGRVGIGTGQPAATLDVYKGEIKISSSGAACTKELAGMLRFTADELQVCNSHGWQSLTVGVPAK